MKKADGKARNMTRQNGEKLLVQRISQQQAWFSEY